MNFKRKVFFKRTAILIFIVISLFITAAVFFVFQNSINMDKQHIQVTSLSADVDKKILQTKITIDDFVIKRDSSILIDLKSNLDTIKTELENLSVIFIEDFKRINNNDLNDFNNEYQIISAKLMAFKDCTKNIGPQTTDSTLFNVYADFSLSYNQFGQYLHKYLYDNTIIYKRKIFGLLAVVFVFMVLAGYMIIYLINRLIIIDRKQVQKAIEIESKERQRIAADLHDGIGAYLSSMNMYIQVLEKDCQENPELIKKLMNLEQLSRQAHQSAEEIINNLNPSLLSKLGIVKALERTIDRINSLDKTQFTIDSSSLHIKLMPSMKIMLYRISMELINNALKHSNAKNANFVIYNARKKVHLIYEDNGIGFQGDMSFPNDDKTGLQNLASRVESVGGKYVINSEINKGVHIEIVLNLN